MELYGTLGGTCSERETIAALFRAGMTGARLNLSHTTLERCAPLLADFWSAAEEAGVKARLIVDLQGPEVRVGTLKAPVRMEPDALVLLGVGGVEIPAQAVECAQVGDELSLDDSAILLRVEEKTQESLSCRVLRGGVLESRKSLAVLGREVKLPVLTAQDLENLRQAKRFCVTDILQPFVRGREDMEQLRAALDELGLSHVRIMAKIENRRGLEHLEEIIPGADEICIARGDLGNNIPLWELPSAQKYIARTCKKAGRDFYVVTQLLWSMQQRSVPTRAEVSDIYNAVMDGSCALMLTGETAAGEYPVQAMEYLKKTSHAALADLEKQ